MNTKIGIKQGSLLQIQKYVGTNTAAVFSLLTLRIRIIPYAKKLLVTNSINTRQADNIQKYTGSENAIVYTAL